jgi:hypothetical protein
MACRVFGGATGGENAFTKEGKVRNKIGALFLAVVLCLLGSAYAGAGQMASEIREVEPFDRVSMKGAGTLYVSQGQPHEVRLEAEEDKLAQVRTYVENGRLIIDRKSSFFSGSFEVKAYVRLPKVKGLGVSGSVQIKGETALTSAELFLSGSGSTSIELDLKVNRLHTSLAGSGLARLKGEAATHTFSASGSAKLAAFELATKRTGIKLSGSGNAEINVSDEVSIKASGSSTVYLKGRARVKEMKTSGASKLKRVD